MATMSVSVTKSVMKGIEKSMSEFGSELLMRAAEKYGFDADEALKELMESVSVKTSGKSAPATKKVSKKVAKKAGPSVPLPFVGVVNEGLCFGIKFNHGLHTQCQVECEDEFCKKCQLQADKNASGKPNYGDIRDRVKEGVSLLEFRDAKGKQTVPYANVVKKMGLDKEMCLREAAKFGVEIPDCHWEERVARRGRPKKSVDVSDTESESSKPKKAKKSAKKDDLLGALKAATAASETSSVSSKSSGSRGRPRLSEEEKARRAEEKAAKKAAADAKKAEARAAKKAAAEAEKAKKAEERAAKKAAAEAEKVAKAEAKAAEKAAKEAEKVKKAEERAAKKAAREAEKVAKAEAKAAKEAEKTKKAEERAAKKAEKEAKKEVKKESEEDKKSVTIDETPEVIPEEFRGCAAPELAMKEAEAAAVVEDSDDEGEDEETECEEFVHNGVTYWKSGNTLYDPETQDEVGTWNPKTGEIVKGVESDEESDGELSEEELSDEE